MIRLAIQGHNTRGKEVIEILEMLGGKTSYECSYKDGFDSSYFFFINTDENFSIDGLAYNNEELKNYYIFTLEEFLEKFPYKVGDRVKTIYGKIGIVSKPIWSNRDNCIRYELEADTDSFYFINELQPYKEETIDKANKAVFDANAQSCDIMNDIIREEMKISNVVLKRYTARKGKSLKWYEWLINPNTRESERILRYSECTAVIDTNQLDGDVMEIPYEEYKYWWDNNHYCLGVTGL